MPTLSDESSRLHGQNAQRCRGFSLAAATEGEKNSRVQTGCNYARLCTRGWNEFEKRVRGRGRVGADLRVRPGCAFPLAWISHKERQNASSGVYPSIIVES